MLFQKPKQYKSMQLTHQCKVGAMPDLLLYEKEGNSGSLKHLKRTRFKRQLIMQIKLAFVFLVCTTLYANAKAISQNVTLNEKNTPLQSVFKKVENQTGYSFWYESNLLKNVPKISVQLNNVKLEQALNTCLKGIALTYSIEGKIIVLKSKPPVAQSVVPVVSTIVEEPIMFSKIKGTITSSDLHQPLIGASIQVKGTNTSTVTDASGNFEITANSGQVLVVSFVGYSTKEITIKEGNLYYKLELTPKPSLLEDIVVVGYKAVSKSDVTGAISSLKSTGFNVGLNMSPTDLMQGRLAGVQMITNGGEPGAGVTVKIRGANSVRSGQSPLYVVDGLPLDITDVQPSGASITGAGSNGAVNPLNFLNPDDIESIDVLKDASASAIYGARGANGVIIITTKKGKAGKGKMSYSGYVGVSDIRKQLPMLSAAEFVAYRASQGVTTDNQGFNTNWQDLIYRSAFSQSHNLSYGGGNETSSYRASLSYLKQDGIVKQTNLEKVTARINMTHSAWNNKLKFEGNITAGRTNNKRVPIGQTGGYEGDVILSALKMNPTFPVYNTNGTYYQPSTDVRNPLAMIMLTDDNTQTDRILGNLSASLTLAKNLVYKVNVGFDNSNATRKVTQDYHLTYLDNKGTVNINNVAMASSLIENYLTYDFNIKKEHKFNALLGHSYQKFSNKSYGFSENGFAVDGINYINNLALGNYTTATTSSNITENSLQSFFTRVNYSLKNKYLLTATLRADGSSKFGDNKKYGFFPSASFAWKMTDEDFIKDLNTFDNLKFRLGWGVTGNQEIPNKISQMLLGSGGASALVNGTTYTGLTLVRTPNPDIHWEKTKQFNIGVDFSVLNSRLSGTIDWFDKTTSDVLLQVYSISPAPTTQVWTNVQGMKISNKGLELTLNGILVDKKKFKWNVGANFTTIKNNVSGLPLSQITTGSPSGPGITGYSSQVIKNGYAIGTFWGRKFLGFSSTGMSVFQTDSSGTAVEMALGNALPKFTYGFNTSINYKNWDLGMFFNGQYGNKVYNNLANILDQKTLVLKGWNTTKNAITTAESTSNTLTYSSRFIENGSFLRLSSATIGYTFNTSKISQYISKLRVYAAGNNLFVITKYSGYDPEVNADHASNGVPSTGIDWTTYPRARTYTIGINVEF